MAAAMWSRCQKVHGRFSGLKPSQSLRKHLTSCLFSTQVVQVDKEVQYPPIKARYPPGEWGYISPKVAWEWQEEMDEIRQTTSVRDRLKKLCEIPERSIWKIHAMTKDPYMLPYQQYLTKTHLIKGLPDLYNTIHVEEELEKLRPAIMDLIVFENGAVDREIWLKKTGLSWYHSSHRTRCFMGQLLHTLMSGLSMSGKFDYLMKGQFDENIRVAGYWHRHGLRKKGTHRPHHPKPQHAGIQIDHLADCQIRVQKPLAPFLPIDNVRCREGEYPNCQYDPVVMGLYSVFGKPTIVAGHWPEDPCPFGLLSVQVVNLCDQLEAEFGADVVKDVRTGYGILAAFSWQLSLAHYQGFNMYLDLTYPFCGQSILTNGKRFCFMAYQLNTLHLWKDDQSNPIRNLCWQTEEMNLFDHVENGEVKGLNDDVLRTILRFLMNAPRSDNLDLKPTFQQGFTSPHLQWPYIADKPPPPAPEKELPLYVE